MANDAMTKNFYIKQLQDPNTNPYGTIQFLINGEDSKDSNKLIFAIMNEVAFGFSSQWETAMDLGALDQTQSKVANYAGSTVGGVLAGISSALKLDLPSDIGQGFNNKRLKVLASTYLSWVNSSTNSFKFDLFRFAITPDEDTLEPFKILTKMVLPSYWASNIIKTPGGYAPPFDNIVQKTTENIINLFKEVFTGKITEKLNQGKDTGGFKQDKDIPGTMTINIGKWCTIRNLVVEDLSFTPSKACTRYGNPLYTRGSITLKPYRMLLNDDIQTMFTHKTTTEDDGKLNDNSFRNPITQNKFSATDYPPSLFGDQSNINY